MSENSGAFEPASKTIFWMVIGVVVTIVVLAFALIIADYRNSLTGVPPELRAEAISLRFTNLPECFAYLDSSTGRAYPGVIDINKFTDEQMNKCYLTEQEQGTKDYNFGLQLKEQSLAIHTNNFFNKVDFALYKEVVVKKGNHWLKDQLIISVQKKI